MALLNARMRVTRRIPDLWSGTPTGSWSLRGIRIPQPHIDPANLSILYWYSPEQQESQTCDRSTPNIVVHVGDLKEHILRYGIRLMIERVV